jgi:hypothetical protein
VDRVTWAEYGQGLEIRLRDLQERLHRGSYHPQPVRRVIIPKAGGKERPLGISSLEDKVVQQAVRAILDPISNDCCMGTSARPRTPGLRPKRRRIRDTPSKHRRAMRSGVRSPTWACSGVRSRCSVEGPQGLFKMYAPPQRAISQKTTQLESCGRGERFSRADLTLAALCSAPATPE